MDPHREVSACLRHETPRLTALPQVVSDPLRSSAIHINYHLTFDIAMAINRGWFGCPSCSDSFGSQQAVDSVLNFLSFPGLFSLISSP